MTHSSIKLFDVINGLHFAPPVKVVLNNQVLYDDYDGDETKPLEAAIKERLPDFERYFVTSIKLDVVSFHHSVVKMIGEKSDE